MFLSRNVFGHDEGVDRDYLRLLFGLYQGSTRPTEVSGLRHAPCTEGKSVVQQ